MITIIDEEIETRAIEKKLLKSNSLIVIKKRRSIQFDSPHELEMYQKLMRHGESFLIEKEDDEGRMISTKERLKHTINRLLAKADPF